MSVEGRSAHGAGGDEDLRPRGRVLDPIDRMAEIVYGVIMVLTFTGSIQVATAGHQEIRTVLFAAFGCNIAWGIVDAVMFVIAAYVRAGRARSLVRRLKAATDEAHADRIAVSWLPEPLQHSGEPSDVACLRHWLARTSVPAGPVGGLRNTLIGALGVFALVTTSTFPLVLPFVMLDDPVLAFRTSNGIALAMLFGIGCALGGEAGVGRLKTGLTMVGIGAVLIVVTIALGG